MTDEFTKGRFKALALVSQFLKCPSRELLLESIYKDIKEESWGWKCMYCDTELTEQTATIDHIKPKFKGGHSTRSNMGACCSKCNSKKGSQLVFDYFNESHPCYSEAKASKIKEWTDQHFVLLSLIPE